METAKTVLRSILALVAGYVVLSILTTATVFVLAQIFPASASPENLGWVVFNVIYGAVFVVIGGYIVAALAPMRPMRHVIGLGIAMALLSVIYAFAVANAPADTAVYPQPGWYYPLLAALAIPSIVLGGWLRIRGTVEEPIPAT